MHLLAAAVIVSAARMGEGGMMRPLCCMELHLLMARGGEQPKRRSVPLPPACHGLNPDAVVTAPQPCLLHLQV